MAESNLEKNFEKLKPIFKAKYGMEWSQDKALYTQFIALQYNASLVEVFAQAVQAMGNEQIRIREALGAIAAKYQV